MRRLNTYHSICTWVAAIRDPVLVSKRPRVFPMAGQAPRAL